jgi:hypothetical protein
MSPYLWRIDNVSLSKGGDSAVLTQEYEQSPTNFCESIEHAGVEDGNLAMILWVMARFPHFADLLAGEV